MSENFKRYALEIDSIWEDNKGIEDLLTEIKNDPNTEQYTDVILGIWGQSDQSCQPILDYISDNPEKFKNLELLYVGDMDQEECEVSWILQGDYSNVLKKLPNLKQLIIKGSSELVISAATHEKIEHLEIICGGLPSTVIKDIASSNYPNLESLVLYLGVDEYGFDGDITTVTPLLKAGKFPKLKNLELINSEIQDDIVKEVISSEILPSLETVSFSFGTLTDIGGNLILDNVDKFKYLEEITIEHHYLSEEMVGKLQEALTNINISDKQEADKYDDDDEYYMYPALTE